MSLKDQPGKEKTISKLKDKAAGLEAALKEAKLAQQQMEDRIASLDAKLENVELAGQVKAEELAEGAAAKVRSALAAVSSAAVDELKNDFANLEEMIIRGLDSESAQILLSEEVLQAGQDVAMKVSAIRAQSQEVQARIADITLLLETMDSGTAKTALLNELESLRAERTHFENKVSSVEAMVKHLEMIKSIPATEQSILDAVTDLDRVEASDSRIAQLEAALAEAIRTGDGAKETQARLELDVIKADYEKRRQDLIASISIVNDAQTISADAETEMAKVESAHEAALDALWDLRRNSMRDATAENEAYLSSVGRATSAEEIDALLDARSRSLQTMTGQMQDEIQTQEAAIQAQAATLADVTSRIQTLKEMLNRDEVKNSPAAQGLINNQIALLESRVAQLDNVKKQIEETPVGQESLYQTVAQAAQQRKAELAKVAAQAQTQLTGSQEAVKSADGAIGQAQDELKTVEGSASSIRTSEAARAVIAVLEGQATRSESALKDAQSKVKEMADYLTANKDNMSEKDLATFQTGLEAAKEAVAKAVSAVEAHRDALKQFEQSLSSLLPAVSPAVSEEEALLNKLEAAADVQLDQAAAAMKDIKTTLPLVDVLKVKEAMDADLHALALLLANPPSDPGALDSAVAKIQGQPEKRMEERTNELEKLKAAKADLEAQQAALKSQVDALMDAAEKMPPAKQDAILQKVQEIETKIEEMKKSSDTIEAALSADVGTDLARVQAQMESAVVLFRSNEQKKAAEGLLAAVAANEIGRQADAVLSAVSEAQGMVDSAVTAESALDGAIEVLEATKEEVLSGIRNETNAHSLEKLDPIAAIRNQRDEARAERLAAQAKAAAMMEAIDQQIDAIKRVEAGRGDQFTAGESDLLNAKIAALEGSKSALETGVRAAQASAIDNQAKIDAFVSAVGEEIAKRTDIVSAPSRAEDLLVKAQEHVQSRLEALNTLLDGMNSANWQEKSSELETALKNLDKAMQSQETALSAVKESIEQAKGAAPGQPQWDEKLAQLEKQVQDLQTAKDSVTAKIEAKKSDLAENAQNQLKEQQSQADTTIGALTKIASTIKPESIQEKLADTLEAISKESTLDVASAMARGNQDIANFEAERQTVVAGFKAQNAKLEAAIKEMERALVWLSPEEKTAGEQKIEELRKSQAQAQAQIDRLTAVNLTQTRNVFAQVVMDAAKAQLLAGDQAKPADVLAANAQLQRAQAINSELARTIETSSVQENLKQYSALDQAIAIRLGSAPTSAEIEAQRDKILSEIAALPAEQLRDTLAQLTAAAAQHQAGYQTSVAELKELISGLPENSESFKKLDQQLTALMEQNAKVQAGLEAIRTQSAEVLQQKEDLTKKVQEEAQKKLEELGQIQRAWAEVVVGEELDETTAVGLVDEVGFAGDPLAQAVLKATAGLADEQRVAGFRASFEEWNSELEAYKKLLAAKGTTVEILEDGKKVLIHNEGEETVVYVDTKAKTDVLVELGQVSGVSQGEEIQPSVEGDRTLPPSIVAAENALGLAWNDNAAERQQEAQAFLDAKKEALKSADTLNAAIDEVKAVDNAMKEMDKDYQARKAEMKQEADALANEIGLLETALSDARNAGISVNTLESVLEQKQAQLRAVETAQSTLDERVQQLNQNADAYKALVGNEVSQRLKENNDKELLASALRAGDMTVTRSTVRLNDLGGLEVSLSDALDATAPPAEPQSGVSLWEVPVADVIRGTSLWSLADADSLKGDHQKALEQYQAGLEYQLREK